MFLSVLLVFATVFVALYLYFRRNYEYWKERGVPYEKPTVFVGNLGHFMRMSTTDFMRNLAKRHKTDYVGIYLGQQPVLVIHSKKLAKKVLVQDFNNFQNRYTHSGDKDDPIGALNLFSVKNPIWSEMKKLLAGMFTSSRLKSLTELMVVNSTELVTRIQSDFVENNRSITPKELFLMYSADTIGNTVFGLKSYVLKDLTSPLWYLTRHMVKWTFWRGFEFSVVFLVPNLAKIMRLKLFSAPATTYIKELFWSLVEERKKLGQKNSKDLLNYLMELKDKCKLPVNSEIDLADNLILAQAAVFIIGGLETAANTLTFLVHELSYHPEAQERLYEEINTSLREKGKSVLEYNDLLELSYLNGCVKETLRKYPVLPYLDRVCIDTYKLTDELTIDAGIPVFVNVTAIHFNEEFYPNPEEWRPERFVGTSESDNKNFEFLTFGEGPRFCIGKRYGFMQLRTAIAHIIMKYRFEPAQPYVIKSDPYSIPLAPLGGGKVKFVPR